MLFSRRSMLKWSAGIGATLFTCPVDLLDVKEAQAAQKLTMQLDWIFNVQFAGLFVAEQKGLYAERDLDIEIKPYERGMIVTNHVANMPFMLGCAEQNLILDAQAQGQPIKALASMFQASPLGLMSLPENPIRTVEDLVGKKIGLDIDGVKVIKLVEAVNKIKPEDVIVVSVDYSTKTEKLLSGECDAVQCYTIDEPIALEQKIGKVPAIFKFADYGYQAYAQVVFASDATIRQDRSMISRFLEGTFLGWKLALEDIPETARLVVEKYAKDTDLEYQIRSLELIEEFVRIRNSNRIGTISKGQWSAMANLMKEHGIIEKVPDLESSLDLDLWSGQV